MLVFFGVADVLVTGDTHVRRSRTGLKSADGECWISRLKNKIACFSITKQLNKQATIIHLRVIKFLFAWVVALRPSQQFFSHVGTEPPLPGYYQNFLGGKCILLKDTTRRPE